MKIAMTVFFIIFCVSAAPFVLGFLDALICSFCHLVYQFIKKPSWDHIWELLAYIACLALLGCCICATFAECDREDKPPIYEMGL